MGQSWKEKLPCGCLRVELPGGGGTPAFSRPVEKEGPTAAGSRESWSQGGSRLLLQEDSG